jgi:hypothetical protein
MFFNALILTSTLTTQNKKRSGKPLNFKEILEINATAGN